MNKIKRSPAYWKRFQFEVLAMIRQLGCPTFYLTLSCADLHWPELFSIISKIDKKPLSMEEINQLNYFERCKMLNENPLFVARHFQHRVELLFAEVLIGSDLLGVLTYYAIRVEYQFRGSLHMHSFLWMHNPQALDSGNIENYIKYLDATIQCYLPDESEDKELHDFVKKYQTHRHSKSCKRYQNNPCRYHYGRYFTCRTLVSIPLADSITAEERAVILNKRNLLLSKVKSYIDEYLDPSKPSFQANESIPSILSLLRIIETDYYEAISISTSEDYEIHLRRPPNSCEIHLRRPPNSYFINNYNPAMLTAWKANMDLQPVYNFYKAVF